MNAAKQVYPQGRASVSLTAGQVLAVSALAACQVYQQVGYPNEPATESLVGTVSGGAETTFTPAGGVAAVYIIQAGASGAAYAVGTGPRVLQNAQAQIQGTPGVLDATGALTAAMMQAGIVTSTTAAAVAGTVPTGTVLDAAVDMRVDDSFDWSVIATGANAFTVTAAASHTLVGNAVVAAGKAGQFRTRKTAAATFVTYRLDGG